MAKRSTSTLSASDHIRLRRDYIHRQDRMLLMATYRLSLRNWKRLEAWEHGFLREKGEQHE